MWFEPIGSWIIATYFKQTTFWSNVSIGHEIVGRVCHCQKISFADFFALLSLVYTQSKSCLLKVSSNHSASYWFKPHPSRCCGCWEKGSFVGWCRWTAQSRGPWWRCLSAVACLKARKIILNVYKRKIVSYGRFSLKIDKNGKICVWYGLQLIIKNFSTFSLSWLSWKVYRREAPKSLRGPWSRNSRLTNRQRVTPAINSIHIESRSSILPNDSQNKTSIQNQKPIFFIHLRHSIVIVFSNRPYHKKMYPKINLNCQWKWIS